MNINVDLSGLDALDRLPAEIEAAAEKGTAEGARVIQQAKVRQVQSTYNRAIPMSSTGRPEWPRSGDWIQGQVVERTSDGYVIKTTGNAAKYEERLANLPTGKDGVNRSNPAAQRAVEITEPQVGKVIEQAIRNALR